MWNGGCSLLSTHLCCCFLLTGWTPHTLPLQGNLCSGTWSPSDCLQGCFSHILSLLPLAAVVQQIFPLLECVIPEALPPSLMGSALASGGSILESAGIGFTGHGGSFQKLLTKASPVVPFSQNPATQRQYNLCLTSLQEIRIELILANRPKAAPQESRLIRSAN